MEGLGAGNEGRIKDNLDSSNWKDDVSTKCDELDYESIMTRGEGDDFALARFEMPVKTWRENSEQTVYRAGGSVSGGDSGRMVRK